jgi:hypothetical protein
LHIQSKLHIQNVIFQGRKGTDGKEQQGSVPVKVWPRPKVTLFVVRWGGAQKVTPVTEGIGGWGAVGCNPSDNYINELVGKGGPAVLGTDYEVWSLFVQNTYELRQVNANFLRLRMEGEKIVGL